MRGLTEKWVEKTLGPAVMEKDEFVLFCDNLDGQTCDAFRDKVRQLGGDTRYWPPGKTDAWQPVDGGFGRKVLTKAEQQEWLEYDKNIEKWIGND